MDQDGGSAPAHCGRCAMERCPRAPEADIGNLRAEPGQHAGRVYEARPSGEQAGSSTFRPCHLRILRGKIGIITPNRYACLNHHRRGTCDNGRSITRDKIEARGCCSLRAAVSHLDYRLYA
ncbi:hypothetical protein [Phyllobacterium sp. SB3]|uniref:hypothetical protein n=1 Tax=Phyllobacterium sp. SB3 TaxID=3156073 RepID=UPI0032AF57C8